jgi:hypothetical protein
MQSWGKLPMARSDSPGTDVIFLRDLFIHMFIPYALIAMMIHYFRTRVSDSVLEETICKG